MKRSPISNHSSILHWKNPYASSIVRLLNSCAKLICARNFLDDNSKLLYFLFHWTESPFCNHRLKYHMDWDIRLAEFQFFSLKLVRFNGFLSVFLTLYNHFHRIFFFGWECWNVPALLWYIYLTLFDKMTKSNCILS